MAKKKPDPKPASQEIDISNDAELSSAGFGALPFVECDRAASKGGKRGRKAVAA